MGDKARTGREGLGLIVSGCATVVGSLADRLAAAAARIAGPTEAESASVATDAPVAVAPVPADRSAENESDRIAEKLVRTVNGSRDEDSEESSVAGQALVRWMRLGLTKATEALHKEGYDEAEITVSEPVDASPTTIGIGISFSGAPLDPVVAAILAEADSMAEYAGHLKPDIGSLPARAASCLRSLANSLQSEETRTDSIEDLFEQIMRQIAATGSSPDQESVSVLRMVQIQKIMEEPAEAYKAAIAGIPTDDVAKMVYGTIAGYEAGESATGPAELIAEILYLHLVVPAVTLEGAREPRANVQRVLERLSRASDDYSEALIRSFEIDEKALLSFGNHDIRTPQLVLYQQEALSHALDLLAPRIEALLAQQGPQSSPAPQDEVAAAVLITDPIQVGDTVEAPPAASAPTSSGGDSPAATVGGSE